MFVAILTGRS